MKIKGYHHYVSFRGVMGDSSGLAFRNLNDGEPGGQESSEGGDNCGSTEVSWDNYKDCGSRSLV